MRKTEEWRTASQVLAKARRQMADIYLEEGFWEEQVCREMRSSILDILNLRVHEKYMWMSAHSRL